MKKEELIQAINCFLSSADRKRDCWFNGLKVLTEDLAYEEYAKQKKMQEELLDIGENDLLQMIELSNFYGLDLTVDKDFEIVKLLLDKAKQSSQISMKQEENDLLKQEISSFYCDEQLRVTKADYDLFCKELILMILNSIADDRWHVFTDEEFVCLINKTVLLSGIDVINSENSKFKDYILGVLEENDLIRKKIDNQVVKIILSKMGKKYIGTDDKQRIRH